MYVDPAPGRGTEALRAVLWDALENDASGGVGRAEGSKVGQRKMWGRELQPMPPELWVSDGPLGVSQCRQRGLALTRHPPG